MLDLNAVLIFIIVFLLAIWLLRRRANLPPGPHSWPLIGNFVQLSQNPGKLQVYFAETGKTFGGLFTFYFGSRPTLVLTDYELIREALVLKADAFSGRPNLPVANRTSDFHEGVVMGNGPRWKSLRRLTLVALRDFGVGKKSLEQRIQEEARAMLDVIRKTDGKPFEYGELLQQSVSNIICSVCFGSRFDFEDAKFKRLVEIINFNLMSFQHGDVANLLRRIVTRAKRTERLENALYIRKFISDQIQEHKETFDATNIRDFVDLHIENEAKEQQWDARNRTAGLHRTIQDLFMAGTETTSTALKWALLYMVHFPEIQSKCHEEVDRVIGRSRPPSLTDRKECSFVEATLLEIQRIATIAPLAVPHCTSEDTTVQGYTIPKGTTVLINLYAVHMDPRLWDTPQMFAPERWLDEKNNIKKQEIMIPFSIGPRACLGEILAKMELFLFFTSLLQEFKFNMVDENNPPPLEGKLGLTYAPNAFSICAIPR